MTDDAFHLTPHDIRAQEFQRGMRGFDPAQVESFKERVAEEVDRLLRARAQLDERVKGLVEQLRAYRDRERALNEALVAAQQLRADIQGQAGREAEVILAQARQDAARVIDEAESEERRVQERIDTLARQLRTYVHSFRALLDRHQSELAAIEEYLEPRRAARRDAPSEVSAS